jgi:hypothetical protein
MFYKVLQSIEISNLKMSHLILTRSRIFEGDLSFKKFNSLCSLILGSPIRLWYLIFDFVNISIGSTIFEINWQQPAYKKHINSAQPLTT